MNQEQAQQDLAFIRELMLSSRQATYVSGAYFIIWALVTGLGQLGTWLIISGKLNLPFHHGISLLVLWTTFCLLGGVATAVVARRDLKAPAHNPAGRLIGLSWLAVCIALLIVFFVGFGFGTVPGELMPAFSALFVGIGVFIMGLLNGLNWMRNLAIGWWVGGAIMLASPGMWNLWFMGLMMFLLYMIPGIMLSRRLES